MYYPFAAPVTYRATYLLKELISDGLTERVILKTTNSGLITEELLEFLRRENGYDLKDLVGFLARNVKRLEATVRGLDEKTCVSGLV